MGGTFTVGVDVHWAVDDTVSNLEHQLVFSDGGAGADLPVELPASLLLEAEPEPQPEPPVSREEIQNRLTSTSFLKPDDPRFFHGRGFQGDKNSGTWPAPHTTWQSNRKPRDDHDAPDWLTASEFEDQEHVMDAKCAALAEMIRLSNKTVVYSGAGISVASCIEQAARGSGADKSRGLDAWPSKTHYALGHLGKHGLIHGWVQQNHDGLPQKAGFPQERINEIHGSWFDPANPVVLYSGQLKGDAYPWMRHDAETADLVIVVGTSLGGLNADQVALKTAKRSMRNMPWAPDGSGGALGTVMINLQQTEQDGKASLRIFGKSDDVLAKLDKQLKVEQHVARAPAVFKQEARVLVPYDREGRRSETAKMWLDLRDGAEVKLTEGHNVQGAQQPLYMHIGASGTKKVNGRFPGPGHGKVMRRDDLRVSYELQIEGVRMTLGQWWIEAAKRGGPPTLPVVNLHPEMVCE